ncbi:MAG: nuclear transport factor 2 family protein [Chloroflexi bacterium]|nr:nuclear transport factor 2 family protein [Chloroflexota bacterium]
MATQTKTQIVQQIYADFGQGNIPAILERLTDEFVWIQPGAPDIPWAGISKTKEQVLAFFQKLAEVVDIEQFEPRQFVSEGDTVVAIGWWKGKSKNKGKSFESDWIMTWTFAGDKVIHYQAAYDTHNVAKALQ